MHSSIVSSLADHFQLYATAHHQIAEMYDVLEAIATPDEARLKNFIEGYAQNYPTFFPLKEVMDDENPLFYLDTIAGEKGDFLIKETLSTLEYVMGAEARFSGFCRAVDTQRGRNNVLPKNFIINDTDYAETDKRLELLKQDYFDLSAGRTGLTNHQIDQNTLHQTAKEYEIQQPTLKANIGFGLQRESLLAETAWGYLRAAYILNEMLMFSLVVAVERGRLSTGKSDLPPSLHEEFKSKIQLSRSLQWRARRLSPEIDKQPTSQSMVLLHAVLPRGFLPN
ncbi:MAG TPA: hypothetical protein VIN59_00360 [Alphaproteobacteria bacterium]